MRRREALAGLGALGVFGAGAAVTLGGVDLSGSEAEIEPVDLQRFDAPGSSPGTETVPEPGRVTYLTMFATWCSTCKAKMDPLGEAAQQAPGDVQFISVTNEPIGETIQPQDVVDWWHEYDGNWPVAHDSDLELTQQLDAAGVPYSVVVDADNSVTWSELGYSDAETILDHIAEAR
jgi:thiol-disulfide isomerase/thioredoxin